MALHRVTKGLNLPLAGSPEQAVGRPVSVQRVGVLGADFHGLRPSLAVREGDAVRRGQLLFADAKIPGVRHTSPAAGTVVAIHRGERRVLQSVVVELDTAELAPAARDLAHLQVPFASYRGRAPAQLDADEVRALLLESGLWTALRTRPFSRIPAPAGTPRSIFVTAMDTHPHAPDTRVVLAGRDDDFRAGLLALATLTPGKVHVCTDQGASPPLPAHPRIGVEHFRGPHPAGTPGLHIHLLEPVDATRTVWHVGCQDVLAIGRLVATGVLDVERVVALGGPGAREPRLLRTRLGASLDELTAGERNPGEQRVISGSVLGGTTAMGFALGYLGRYHQQVSVVPEGRERRMFGYITPGADRFSVWPVVLGALTRRPLALTTSTNGGPRAMVPIGSYERVMPMDLMPTFLLRALIARDIEQAEELGVLELDEEDLALCTFVCPGKTEYGPLLRDMLARIEKEG